MGSGHKIMVRDISYLCALCGENRVLSIQPQKHKARIGRSANGLAELSDIHHCKDGILSINNLHVDANYDVRSFTLMELPDRKPKAMSRVGIPSPVNQHQVSTYRLTEMIDGGGYRITLVDDQLEVNFNIGEIKVSEEYHEKLVSDGGNVILYYFQSHIPLRRNNRA